MASPPGGEEQARASYAGVLGFIEIAKPAPLRARGGAWFAIDDIEFHAGVDADFRPAHKAHTAFV